MLIPLVIYMYYALIESRCLRYAFAYAFGGLDFDGDSAARMRLSEAYFSRVSAALTTASCSRVIWIRRCCSGSSCSPVYLGAVFVGFCVQSLPDYLRGLLESPVALSTLGVVGAVFASLVAMAVSAERRWNREAESGALPAPAARESR